MGFLGLCKGDPVVDLLHDLFAANVLRVPEARVQPLSVLARRENKQSFRGALAPLLSDGAVVTVDAVTSQMAELSGKHTRGVKVDLGLEVLGGFLSGLGLPSAGITVHFSRARTVSFTFADVQRRWIDPGLLGAELKGREVDRTQPAAGIYFGDDPWALLVVDSALTSNQFSIQVESSTDGGAVLNVPAIQEIVAQAKVGVEVSSTASTEVSFRGKQHLTFAFTCLRLYLDAQARIQTLDPTNTMLNAAVASGELAYLPDRVRLSAEPAMIEWDELG